MTASKKPRINSVPIFVLVVFCLCLIIIFHISLEPQFRLESSTEAFPKIVIGVVSCRKENETDSNLEAIVLIKSILISAQLYHSRHIELHIFLEYDDDKAWFRKKILGLGYDSTAIKVDIVFHSALAIVPEQYHERMIKQHWRRCTFVRLFIPNSIANVDSMIYLDTDFLITGNIAEMWNEFKNMKSRELIGMVGNNELKETSEFMHEPFNCFKDLPYYQPRGLNAGLLLMNLTNMREFGWEERILRFYEDYSSIAELDDQKLINMFFYFNPGRLYLLPCQYNIRCEICDYGFLCDDVKTNEYGIQALHGTNENFPFGGRFNYIYKIYERFNMAEHDLLDDLILPIRTYPEPIFGELSRTIFFQCKVSINHLLFKNLVDDVEQ